jgi:hypothetical protein
LNAVILGIDPIRIGGANKVGREGRSNFWRKIVEHIGIVGGTEAAAPVVVVPPETGLREQEQAQDHSHCPNRLSKPITVDSYETGTAE